MITKAVDHIIKETFNGKTDVVNYLINHPNKEKFIGNLKQEINLAQLQFGKKIGELTIKEIITSFTKIYCHAALTAKENELKQKRDSSINEMLKK
jgi:hypothetical protein